MSRFLGLLLLIVAIALTAYVGCGPRMGVAKDKVIAKIDEMLGKLDVKLKKVEMAYADLEKSTEGQREKRIDSKVRLEKLQADAVQLEAEKAKLLDEIKKVQPLLVEAQSAGKIERNGKEISIDELKAFADEKLKQFNSLEDQLKTRVTPLTTAYAKSLEAIKKNETTSKTQLEQLANQIELIKSKKSALETMKVTSSIVAPGESLSDQFTALTKDVGDLLVDVDVQLQTEIEKIDERAAKIDSAGVSLEELLNDKTDASGTVNKIDELLKKQGGGE